MAVILTSEDQVAKWAWRWSVRRRYSDTTEAHMTIESNLTECIIECINNEIVLHSVTDSASLFQVHTPRPREA